MSGDSDIRALEGKFFSAFERGDTVAIAECYAPQMRIWNNIEQRELSGAEHIAGLEASAFARFADRRYVDVRTDLFAEGFVRQHVITGLLDGNSARIPMCIVCRVRDGKMMRIDEYMTFPSSPAAGST